MRGCRSLSMFHYFWTAGVSPAMRPGRPRSRFYGIAAACLLAALNGASALAAAPAPVAETPDLLAKAKAEGTVVWYTSIELQTAERIAKAFEAAHPGVKVQ